MIHNRVAKTVYADKGQLKLYKQSLKPFNILFAHRVVGMFSEPTIFLGAYRNIILRIKLIRESTMVFWICHKHTGMAEHVLSYRIENPTPPSYLVDSLRNFIFNIFELGQMSSFPNMARGVDALMNWFDVKSIDPCGYWMVFLNC